MKYAKLDNCWLNLESDTKIGFGEFAIRQYNSLLKFKLNNSTFPAEIENTKEANNVIDTLMEIIKIHLSAKDIQEKTQVIDSYLKLVYSWINYMPITHECINGKWCIVYNINETATTEDELKSNEILKEWMVFLDLQEMRNSNYAFTECKECQRIFISNNRRRKYCTDCSIHYKPNYDKKRQHTPKGRRDKIVVYMRESGKYTHDEIYTLSEISDFINESDKMIATLSEDDFIKWCEEKHNYYLQETKRRKQNKKMV